MEKDSNTNILEKDRFVNLIESEKKELLVNYKFFFFAIGFQKNQF